MFLSIITPTFNEAQNIKPFIFAISKVIEDLEYEIIFVDDNSTDKTYEIVKKIARQNNRIRCLRRIGRRGLSSAVIEGCLSSSANYLLVMDTDLQHDEKKIPEMLKIIKKKDIDLVIGSRFLTKISSKGLSKIRNFVSKLANFLANKIAKVELSDPMSGYFVIDRNVFDKIAPNLTGLGFKILLDIFSSSIKQLRFIEIQSDFKKRKYGESKLDFFVVWEYLLLLWEVRFGKIIPARFISFCMIGGSGVFVHLISLYIFYSNFFNFFYAQLISTLIAMTSNFYLNNIFTYRDRRKKGIDALKALILFYITCGIGAAANVGIANSVYLGNVDGLSGIWYISGIIGAFVGAVWNFLMSSLVTWKQK